MNDLEKTRKIGGGNGDQKTRLIRPTDDQETVLVNARRAPPGDDPPKTRLVRRPSSEPAAPAVDAPAKAAVVEDDTDDRLVVGWLVVTGGLGRGKFSPIFDGMNSVGRGADQATRLDFGDETISREGHAFITYDYVARKFYIQHGGKSNLVRVNQAPVLQPTELKQGDEISLGNTVLRFVPFCGENFDWQDK
ncbi:MAG: FHA domain-containing protein [Rhodopseudomonas sp.]|nr:FHA domain-containing protein [Rhodopseudomonas sp.]